MPNTIKQAIPLYRALAQALEAVDNCGQALDKAILNKDRDAEDNYRSWYQKHRDRIDRLVKKHMPSGSGFNNGTTMDQVHSDPDRLCFHTSFHHMNDVGFYAEWTQHDVVVTPSLADHIHLKTWGRDRGGIKDFIYEVFREALTTPVDPYPEE